MNDLIHSEVLQHILRGIDEAERSRKGIGDWRRVRNHIRNARRAAGGGNFPARRRGPGQWSVDLGEVEKHLQEAKIAAMEWDREENPQSSDLHIRLVEAIRRARICLPAREN